jgi:hypothetical protein
MRIPSGTTDQYIYFVAVDATDFTSRETGLSSFTVYRSRDGGAAAAMTTPTINETDATNMPGVYELLLDEDMTIGSGNDNEEICLHITHAGMAPVTRTIELYRPKMSVGETLLVSGNRASADVAAISGDTAAAANCESFFDGTGYAGTNNVIPTVTTLTGHTPQTGDTYALANGAAGFVAIDTVVDAVKVKTDQMAFTTGHIHADVGQICSSSIPASNFCADYDGTGYAKTNSTIGIATTAGSVSGNVTGTVGGIAGTIQTLDALDTAQDSQHSTTQSAISGLNDLSAAEVNAQVDSAIETYHLDHLFAADYDPASPPGTATALLNELIESDGGVSRFTVNALENAPSGTGASAAAIADAVWEEAIADHSGTSGSTAEALNAAGSAGDPWTTALPGSYTGTQAGKILSDVLTDTADLQANQGNWLTATGFSTHDASAVVTALGTGSTLSALATAAELAKVPKSDGAVSWNATALASINTQCDTAISDAALATAAALATVDSNVDAILVDTGTTLPASIATIDTNVDAILVDTGTTIPGTITTLQSTADAIETDTQDLQAQIGTAGAGLTDLGGMSTAMLAEVQAECVDALQETVPDSIPADGTRPNMQQAAYMILQSLTEFAISGTTITVKKPDGSTTLFTNTLDDGTNPTSSTRAT